MLNTYILNDEFFIFWVTTLLEPLFSFHPKNVPTYQLVYACTFSRSANFANMKAKSILTHRWGFYLFGTIRFTF